MHSNADNRRVAGQRNSVRQFTPLSSFLKSPESLATSEYILVVLRDYHKGSYESGTWRKGDGEYSPDTNKVQYNAIIQLNAFSDYCNTAWALFERNCFREAGLALSAAMANVNNIVFAEHPNTLSDIFKACHSLLINGRGEIILATLRQFSAMGQLVLGERHPLSLIFRWLCSLCQYDSSGFGHAIPIFLQAMADLFESALGPLHYTTLFVRFDFIDITPRDTRSTLEFSATVNVYQKLLRECESSLGGSDLRTQLVRGRMANFYMYEGKSAQVIEVAQSIIDDADNMRMEDYRRGYKEIGFYEKAWGQYSLGQTEAAVMNMRKALKSSISQVNFSDDSRAFSIQMTHILEDWLEERGELESAAEMHESWTNLCKPLEKLVL